MNLLSKWKFTIDPAVTPVVILDYGLEMAEEPLFTLRRGLEVVPIPYGVPLLRPTKADVYDFQFTIVYASESDAIARRDMLNQLSERYDQLDVAAMRWQVEDLTDRYFQFSSAFFHTAGVRRLVDHIAGGWSLAVAVTAVGLTRTIV